MKDLRKTVKYILFIVLIVCVTIFATKAIDSIKKEKTITEATLQEKLKPIAEVSTYEYDYTTMGKFESHTDFYGYKVPFTTSKFLITYDGVIKAGFNFDDLKISVKNKTIEITIPQIKITSHVIMYNTMQVYDEQQSIFNPISITDFTGFYADNSKSMETKAINNGLFYKAKTNAINVIESFLRSIVGDEYTIIIK